jgi:hypothetical protein
VTTGPTIHDGCRDDEDDDNDGRKDMLDPGCSGMGTNGQPLTLRGAPSEYRDTHGLSTMHNGAVRCWNSDDDDNDTFVDWDDLDCRNGTNNEVTPPQTVTY